MILEAEELDEIQQAIADIYADTMPNLAYIQRANLIERDTANPEIIIQEYPSIVYDEMPCSYRRATPREIELLGMTQGTNVITIDFAPVYEIRQSDSGHIYEKGNTAGIDFEVTGFITESNATFLTVVGKVI